MATAETRRRKRQHKRRRRAEAAVDAQRKPCGCEECLGDHRWPDHYLGSNAGHDLAPEIRQRLLAAGKLRDYLLSYECYLESTAPDFRPADDRPSFDGRMSPAVACPRKRREGLGRGMSILPAGRVHNRYVSGCEGPGDGRHETCGSLRPRADRYCLGCRDLVAREMAAAGYSVEQIDAWCAGGKFPTAPENHNL